VSGTKTDAPTLERIPKDPEVRSATNPSEGALSMNPSPEPDLAATLSPPAGRGESEGCLPDGSPSQEQAPLIDTSKMPEGQRAALELAEAARETEHPGATFAAKLFMGRLDLCDLFPFPRQHAGDRAQGDAFLEPLKTFLHAHVDPDEIDRTGEIPPAVIEELAQMGAFGIKIPSRYGGLGLSQTNYCRAAMLLGSHCGNLTALLSAHQSIGVPQPLLLFGDEEQKRKFLPRLAKGEISAFALTEPNVGSDPARMETHAEPTADGKLFILNGEKLWCTNGTKAGVIVVMAKTPPRMVNGKPKSQITAFLVEMNTPGVEVIYRCRFMGLRASGSNCCLAGWWISARRYLRSVRPVHTRTICWKTPEGNRTRKCWR
jgi:hypothetical protein